MIGLSLFGKPELAADFGVIHGATVALFYAFSGNARSLILSAQERVGASYILRLRCILLVPLYSLAIMLSFGLVASGFWIIMLLISRRACEWLAEVFLSEQERRHHSISALIFFITQGVLSLVVLISLIFDSILRYPALALWAISPLFWCVRKDILLDVFKASPLGAKTFKALLPHFGSTAVIGISVYVIRVIILLLAGRQIAGDLFSAFAMGGILGAIFSQALGPTLVRNEGDFTRASPIVRALDIMLFGSFGCGVLILLVAQFCPELLVWTGKGAVFWLAVGCSFIGGPVMVKAQRIRLRLLQSFQGQDSFGSDILANILLVVSVPFLYFGLGTESLSGVYLLGALLSLAFYSSEAGGLFARFTNGRWVLFLLMVLLFLPLFFQLSGGIYHDVHDYYTREARLMTLPMPVSILACYLGIIIFGKYSSARTSLVFIFFIFIGMLLTSFVLAADYGFDERSKLLLLLQYMLPMFAMVLGQQYAIRNDAILVMAISLFWILSIIIPLQLVLTFMAGASYLSSSLYFFSIHQSASYVPVVFVGGFFISLSALWNVSSYRVGFLLLSCLMGFYAFFSASLIALVFLIVGNFSLLIRHIFLRVDIFRALITVGISLMAITLAFQSFAGAELLRSKGITLLDSWSGDNVLRPFREALELRSAYWDFYGSGIIESTRSFLLGHEQILDRQEFPSAYNYYLEFLYNFGVLAALPLLVMIGFIIYSVVRKSSSLLTSHQLSGLTFVVLFLLLIDNFLQVGMRQPYPGIVIFFLLGILLSKLSMKEISLMERKRLDFNFC